MRYVLIAGLLVLGLLGIYALSNRSGDGPEAPTRTGPSASATAGSSSTERRSLLEDVQRRGAADGADSDATRAPEPEPEPEAPPLPEGDRPRRSPVEGLRVESASSADVAAAGVPDAWSSGVVVTKVIPDSPADEVRLKPGDLIVEVRGRSVRQPDDLPRIVGDNSYAKVTFVRNREVLQVVLQRPFSPN